MKSQTILLILAALLLVATGAQAQSDDDLDLSWWTMDGGGATFSTGGPYTLGSTIGQPDAGMLTAAHYTLGGGFWRAAAAGHTIHLPLILRSH
jgi:hypothetical protein